MLKAKARKPWQDGLRCDDCGREWVEVLTIKDGPDDRGFVSLWGALGDQVVKRTLCPECVEDLIDLLAVSVDRERIIKANREYVEEHAEAILHGLMPIAEPDVVLDFEQRKIARRRELLLRSLELSSQLNDAEGRER